MTFPRTSWTPAGAVEALCRALNVSRAGYYAWLKREKDPRQIRRETLIDCISRVHRDNRGVYGFAGTIADCKRK